jgi:hypothetical protein
MRSECRGVVFIINNQQFDRMAPRVGSNFDRDGLQKLFQDLHFKIIVENDLTAQVSHHYFCKLHHTIQSFSI